MTPDAVLSFWFPQGHDRDEATHRAQIMWWFRSGTGVDEQIRARFADTLEQARRGALDGWAVTPRGRLALILVLDQFSRSIYRGTPHAFAQDARARTLTLEGLQLGAHDHLTAWELMFFTLPLGHSEVLALHELARPHLDEMVRRAPPHLRALYELSRSQGQGHLDVIKRFGRHPHRNQVLGRTSTMDELAYLRDEVLVHQRPIPK